MDHIRLLGFMRSIQTEVIQASRENAETRHVWNIHPGVVVMPETLCPWCRKALRSNGIWLFSHPPTYLMLEGMISLNRSGKLRVESPGHPNCTGGSRGGLCLGTYRTGMALLAGPANLNDCPMGLQNLPAWYRRYWDHRLCPEGLKWYLDNNRIAFEAIPFSEREHLENV